MWKNKVPRIDIFQYSLYILFSVKEITKTKYNNSEIAVCRHYGIHVKNNDNPVAVFAKANGKWEECYLFIKNTNNSNIASANYWHCTY